METKNIEKYIPCGVVVAMAVLFALAHGGYSFLSGFLGFFLCLAAMLKFFDLQGFQQAFQEYDIVTQRYPFYGYLFPLFEMILGLGFITNTLPILVSLLTLVLMSVTAFGVIRCTLSGKKATCAFMGTVFNHALSTMSIVGIVGVALLALINLVRSI